MSNEERMVEIGKAVTERMEAKKDAALLLKRIQDAGGRLNKIGPLLIRQIMSDVQELKIASEMISGILSDGGLEQTRKDIEEFLSLQTKIGQLTAHLHQVGAE